MLIYPLNSIQIPGRGEEIPKTGFDVQLFKRDERRFFGSDAIYTKGCLDHLPPVLLCPTSTHSSPHTRLALRLKRAPTYLLFNFRRSIFCEEDPRNSRRH
eukprot:974749-Amorphochlora_amoeboformis.AAC.1